MSPIGNALGISQIATVIVPVTDQERALEFYVEKLGFEKRVDFQYGDEYRWIEVAPLGSAVAMALVSPAEGSSARIDQTSCALTTSNIESDHAALQAKGVDVDGEIARKGTRRSGLTSVLATIVDPVPAQFFFRDPDGNRFLVVDAS
jgi:catechol 2,3-dioxygenase-like lactoylglutathione lyase family enzyme